MFLNSLNAAYPNKRSSQLTVASVPRMPRKFEPILLSESSREEEVQPKSNADVTQETSPHNMSMIVVDSDDSDDCVIIDGTSSQTLLTDSRSKELNLSKTSGSSSSDPLGEIRHQAEDECVDCKTCGRRVPRASMQLHEGRCKPVAASSSTNESNPTVNSAATPTKAGADLTSITFLKGLLPFWSTEHLQALLDSHNGQVEQSYEGALALASNGDPDSIPVAMRDAILRSLTLGFAGSRSLDDDNDDTPSKRPRYEASTSSSSNSLNPPEFSSYAFRLLLSIGVSAEGNREATTLGALVPDNGRLIGAVVFNMMIDFDFLCNEIPALRRLRGEQLTIISGRDQLVGNIPEGVHVHYPPLPEYGSHHSKGLLCYYEGGDKGRGTRDGPHCVFVVCTANFLHVDVRMKTNGVWAAVAPMKGATSASSCEFEDDLYSYFEHYNARNHAVKTIRSKGELSSTKASTSSTRQEVVDSSRIRKYDFSAVRGVKLIASAPGIHAGGWQGVHSGPEAWRWGHLAVRRFLASHNRKKASRVGSISSSSSSSSSSRVDNDEPRRLVCQFTSMGNVHEKWLYHQFADSMVGAHDQDTDMRRYGAKLKPPQGGKWAATLPIELVVPSVEKVRSSTEGYAGGGSIPLPHKNIGKDFFRPLLHRYDEGSGTLGRNRTLPHIKSYCVYSHAQTSAASSTSPAASSSVHLDYFLLTSANLSMAAWGQLQNCDKSNVAELKILSYELGVLFYNDLDSPSGNLVPVTPGKTQKHGEQACPVPYELPPKPYSYYDEPWAVDGRYLEPDGFGQQWPIHIQLYGPDCTSRRGIAPPP